MDADTGNPEPDTVADPLVTLKELVESVGTVTVASFWQNIQARSVRSRVWASFNRLSSCSSYVLLVGS